MRSDLLGPIDDIEAIPSLEINEMEAASRREMEARAVFFEKWNAYRECVERSSKYRVMGGEVTKF